VATPEPFVVGDLAALFVPSSRYTILSATQSVMDTGGADLTDSVEFSFMVTGRDGTFTGELPIVGFRVFEDGIDLTSWADTIDALYSL